MRSCADRFLHADKLSSEADKEITSLLVVADLTNADLPTLLGLLRSGEGGRQHNSRDSHVGMCLRVFFCLCVVCSFVFIF